MTSERRQRFQILKKNLQLDCNNIMIVESHYWNARLCELVKKHPCIYDATHENYRKVKAMDKAWKIIGTMCHETATSCRKRFRNLRTAYENSIGLFKRPKNSKPYYLHKELEFLNPFLLPKRGGITGTTNEETTTEPLSDSNDSSTTCLVLNRAVPTSTTNEETTTEPLSDSNDSLTALENTTTLAWKEMDVDGRELAKFSAIESIDTATSSDFTASILTDYQQPSATLEGDTDEIIMLDDTKFLYCMLYAMQDMNKRQKHIFKSKIWEGVYTVLDEPLYYPSNHKTCSVANAARHNIHHSDYETVKQQLTSDIARLNKCELREIEHLIKQRESEIEIPDNSTVNHDNIVCNNKSGVADSATRTPLLDNKVEQTVEYNLERQVSVLWKRYVEPTANKQLNECSAQFSSTPI